MGKDLLTFTSKGIYCPRGDFFIDPHKPVHRAVVTHAHSDHARWGHKYYMAQQRNRHILKLRLGDIKLELKGYGEVTMINGVKMSFHSAAHVWGSSQVRVEYKGEVWVVSGDYKLEDDGFSGSFEPVKCNTFITECTFGLPIFKWRPQDNVYRDINDWWRRNSENAKTSILTAYAFGKAQRLIQNIDHSIGNVYVHKSIENVNNALIQDGAVLPEVFCTDPSIKKTDYHGSLVITPGYSFENTWLSAFHPCEVATVSGWIQVKGIKKKRRLGQGFVLSDHADWAGLNEAVRMTGADRVFVMHGYTDVYARWLRERGYRAAVVESLRIRE